MISFSFSYLYHIIYLHRTTVTPGSRCVTIESAIFHSNEYFCMKNVKLENPKQMFFCVQMVFWTYCFVRYTTQAHHHHHHHQHRNNKQTATSKQQTTLTGYASEWRLSDQLVFNFCTVEYHLPLCNCAFGAFSFCYRPFLKTNQKPFTNYKANRTNRTTNQQAHQMKINHSQNILSPSKLHSISSLPLSAKDILSAETNVAYASTALIIANTTNLNELQADDNIFSNKLPICKHLLSPLSIDTVEQCGKNAVTDASDTEEPPPMLQSPIKYDSNSDYINNLRNSYRKTATDTPTETTNSIRSSGRRPFLSYQNRFLSLSISPPLSRRQDMPVLRGTFVSL